MFEWLKSGVKDSTVNNVAGSEFTAVTNFFDAFFIFSSKPVLSCADPQLTGGQQSPQSVGINPDLFHPQTTSTILLNAGWMKTETAFLKLFIFLK